MKTSVVAKMKPYYQRTMESPVGKLNLVASDEGLAAILWEVDKPGRVDLNIVEVDSEHPILKAAEDELMDYFLGRKKKFTVPLDFKGTEFRKKVWQALLTIPFGETRTYGQIATQIGQPKAMRAVGMAANRNPIAIIAPCHRVVGAKGDLVGFAGGLKAKTVLLGIEGREVDVPKQMLLPAAKADHGARVRH